MFGGSYMDIWNYFAFRTNITFEYLSGSVDDQWMTYTENTSTRAAVKISNIECDRNCLNEWVGNCCLTLSEQVVSHIMARTSYIPWDDDDVRFVLDLHA
jgi:hypothetical protein